MLKLSTKKMLNLIISCTRFKRNYSGCTCRSSENLCSSSGGKKNRGWNSGKHKFPEFHPPLLISSYVWPNSGYWCCRFVSWLYGYLYQGLFLANFRHLETRKKCCRIQQRDFLEFFKRIRHILRKKKLEIVRFRQCVFSRSPEPGRIPKKSSSPPGQSPVIANQCWGSSPVHLLEEFEKINPDLYYTLENWLI